MKSILSKVDLGIDKSCRVALAVAVALMLSLTIMNIVLRWMGQSLLWVEPLVRHLVFVSAFLGGALATGSRSHIGIDILPRVLEAKGLTVARDKLIKFIAFFSFLVTLGLTWAGILFAQQEFQYGKPAFLEIHSGVLVSIIPVGFAIIALRSLLQIFIYEPKQENH